MWSLPLHFSSPCPQEQEPTHRKASDRLPSYKLADRCCLKNQWGSNGLRNISRKWTMPIWLWKQALNQLTMLFPGRLFRRIGKKFEGLISALTHNVTNIGCFNIFCRVVACSNCLKMFFTAFDLCSLFMPKIVPPTTAFRFDHKI